MNQEEKQIVITSEDAQSFREPARQFMDRITKLVEE